MSDLFKASSPDRSIIALASPNGTSVKVTVVRIDPSLTKAEIAKRAVLVVRRAQFQAWFAQGLAFREQHGVYDPERKAYIIRDEVKLDEFRTSMYPEQGDLDALDDQMHKLFSGQPV